MDCRVVSQRGRNPYHTDSYLYRDNTLTGEFFPKTIFRINPNSSLRVFSTDIRVLGGALSGVGFTTWLSKALMWMAGIRNVNHTLGVLTVGDLNQYIQTNIDERASEAKVENEVKIFHNAIDFRRHICATA